MNNISVNGLSDCTEVRIEGQKNGMIVLAFVAIIYILAIIGLVASIDGDDISIIPLFVFSLLVLCIAWFPLLGLRVLKPQEALLPWRLASP